MAKRRELNAMSAEELYALARQREREEKELEKESAREEIAELETQKKDLIAEYKAAVGELDKAIRKLRKKVGATKRVASSGRVGRKGSTTSRVLEIIDQSKSARSKDIKARLEEEGLATKYLPQILASLKRQGKIISGGRGIYKLA